jgi:hypothetical protein
MSTPVPVWHINFKTKDIQRLMRSKAVGTSGWMASTRRRRNKLLHWVASNFAIANHVPEKIQRIREAKTVNAFGEEKEIHR